MNQDLISKGRSLFEKLQHLVYLELHTSININFIFVLNNEFVLKYS